MEGEKEGAQELNFGGLGGRQRGMAPEFRGKKGGNDPSNFECHKDADSALIVFFSGFCCFCQRGIPKAIGFGNKVSDGVLVFCAKGVPFMR